MAEEDLRQAAKSGDTENVTNLLASGTKQVADEVRIYNIKRWF